MELKKFRNKFGLELIPASHENIILGTLVWDPLIGKPKMEHKGMPKNIYTAFLDAELILEIKWKKYIENVKNENIVQAHMAERSVHFNAALASTLENPTLGKIQNNFELEKISNFSFGDIQVRNMSNLTRIRIDGLLEILKMDNWHNYDGKIRRVFMITELYYGSIKITTKTKWKNEFETSISKTDLDLKNSIDLGNDIEYTFDHKDVPFAMRLERVKDFNG